MLFQNTQLSKEASKFLAMKKLNIKTDFSITKASYYLLQYKLSKYV